MSNQQQFSVNLEEVHERFNLLQTTQLQLYNTLFAIIKNLREENKNLKHQIEINSEGTTMPGEEIE